MVRPTICGMIVEARDQVRSTIFCPLRINASTRLISFSSTYGPFFVDRDIAVLLSSSALPNHAPPWGKKIILVARPPFPPVLGERAGVRGPSVSLSSPPLPRTPVPNDILVSRLVIPCLIAQGRLAPGRLGTGHPDGRLALTAAVRMIARVHSRATHFGSPSSMAAAPGLTEFDIVVFRVARLSDCGHAVGANTAHLTRRKPDQTVVTLLGHELRTR